MAIMVDHKAAVKEMEAGSIAWTAQLFGKPMLCIKARTRARTRARAPSPKAAARGAPPNRGAPTPLGPSPSNTGPPACH